MLHALGRGSPTVAPLRVTLCAPSWSREAATSCGGRRRLRMLLRPCGATVGRSFSDLSLGGRWGFSPQTLAKEPSALWTLIRGDCHWSKARRATGAPRLQGSRRTEGAPRRGACKALPIRHGTAVTPSPLGKAFLLSSLGRGSPTVAPLRVRVAHSASVERGGDLLRRPTEVTPAPPAMHHCGKPYRSRPVPLHLPGKLRPPTSAASPPSRAQRGRPTGAARPPADN